ncbi:MAG TPA: hydrogenase formation protein HypD [Actinobacteria bacterium]|nr:hydrogenase formation protein HypD [Actinomycetota bacterium]
MQRKINDLKKSIEKNRPADSINIMEVCGTHTMAISRGGLRQLLPDELNLISGPGCPVCVTSNRDIDHIIGIIRNYPVTLFTFGDMIRVPGTDSSLQLEKSRGKDVRICYSPLDALEYARNNPDREVVYIAIGFETTAPLSAVLVKRAYSEDLKNFHIFNTHKLVPPALELLLLDREINIDAFLCPGHVSAIIGSEPYQFIADKYNIPCVISGFEPLDILESLDMILKQCSKAVASVQIQYGRVVKPEGNPTAAALIDEVFEPADSYWRGIGILPLSGLKLRDMYSRFDAAASFPVKLNNPKELPGCKCGDVLKGILKPNECKLFATVCTPENPVGPCMVSSEGSCAAYYKYERVKIK